MDKFYSILLIASLKILMTSCAKSEVLPKEYVAWCDNIENGLIKEYHQDDIQITCAYTPADYVVLKQHNPSKLDENQINSEINSISELHQFKLRFQKVGNSNFMRDNYTTADEFNTRSMYLSYAVQSDLNLVSGNDTVECLISHYERTYGNTPFETLLITFPKSGVDQREELELIFNDRVFGLGRVKFHFSKDVLNKIPSLVF